MSYKLSKIQKISMESLSFVLTIIPMHVREESNKYAYFMFYQILKKETP